MAVLCFHTCLWFKPFHRPLCPFLLPSSRLALELLVLRSAARWAVWACPVSYVTSLLAFFPPARWRCITCLNKELFLCFSEAQIWSFNGDDLKHGATALSVPTPLSGKGLTCYIMEQRWPFIQVSLHGEGLTGDSFSTNWLLLKAQEFWNQVAKRTESRHLHTLYEKTAICLTVQHYISKIIIHVSFLLPFPKLCLFAWIMRDIF